MANLYISHDGSGLVEDCCPDNIGAILFTDSEEALKNDGFGAYTPQSYVRADHEDYIITLSEPAERSFYYFVDLDEAQFTLPETPAGRWYELEIWYSTTTSVWDRDVDTLRELRRVIWDGSNLIDARLGAGQVADMSQWIAHASVGYDHTTNTVYFTCWLEQDGSWVQDPKSVTILWHDSVGNEILNVTVSTFNYVTGIFQFNAANIDLTPDRVTPIQVAITAQDDTVYTSLATVVSWD